MEFLFVLYKTNKKQPFWRFNHHILKLCIFVNSINNIYFQVMFAMISTFNKFSILQCTIIDTLILIKSPKLNILFTIYIYRTLLNIVELLFIAKLQQLQIWLPKHNINLYVLLCQALILQNCIYDNHTYVYIMHIKV